MTSVKIRLNSRKGIMLWHFVPYAALTLTGLGFAIYYLGFVSPSNLSCFNLLFSIAFLFALIAQCYFVHRQALEQIDDLEIEFDDKGLYHRPNIRIGGPVIKVGGMTFCPDIGEKDCIPWNSDFSAISKSKRYVYMKAMTKSPQKTYRISMPRKTMIENADEIVSFLESLPVPPKNILKAL